jgi:hypothetical protein
MSSHVLLVIVNYEARKPWGPLPNDVRTFYATAKSSEVIQMREWLNLLRISTIFNI